MFKLVDYNSEDEKDNKHQNNKDNQNKKQKVEKQPVTKRSLSPPRVDEELRCGGATVPGQQPIGIIQVENDFNIGKNPNNNNNQSQNNDRTKNNQSTTTTTTTISNNNQKSTLPPLPNFITTKNNNENNNHSLFSMENVNAIGKVLQFPRVDGHWLSFVFIPIESNQSKSLLNQIQQSILPMEMKADYHSLDSQLELHCSLSRPFPIRELFMQQLVDNFRTSFGSVSFPKTLEFGPKLEWFVAENQSRSFLALSCERNSESDLFIKQLISIVDNVLKQFRLSTYYEDPKPHLTIGWIGGNVNSLFPNLLSNNLKQLEKPFSVEVDCIRFLSGNRHFKIS